MKVLTSPSEIRKVIKDIKPDRIAVAFVGMGWDDYVFVDSKTEVVVSPTIGSNPNAIVELRKKIGSKNVHFLDDLHAKIYIGKNKALLGSCNLSNNGMSDVGLHEAAVLIEDKDQVAELGAVFEHYKILAQNKYKDDRSKLDKLKRMKEDWSRSIRNGCYASSASPSEEVPALEVYSEVIDRIHIVWHGRDADIDFDEEVIESEVPEINGKSPSDFFDDYMLFSDNDDVREGDWVLSWRCNDNGRPTKNGRIAWMYVDRVIPHGAKHKYSKMACQLVNCDILEPFKLSDVTKQAIRDALVSGGFDDFLGYDDTVWSVPGQDRVEKFIKYVRDNSV